MEFVNLKVIFENHILYLTFSKFLHIFAMLKQNNMKRNIGLIFVGILLLFSLFSCSDPIDYPIQIVNNTPYRIDKLEFGGSLSGPVISIEPMSTSEQIHVTYTESFGDVMGDPEYLISVTQYSNESNTFENDIWRFFALGQGNPKTNNVISIELAPMVFYDNDIFEFIMN